jgi:hypothetical protein
MQQPFVEVGCWTTVPAAAAAIGAARGRTRHRGNPGVGGAQTEGRFGVDRDDRPPTEVGRIGLGDHGFIVAHGAVLWSTDDDSGRPTKARKFVSVGTARRGDPAGALRDR